MRGQAIIVGSVSVLVLCSIFAVTAFAQTINTCGINFVSGNSVNYGSLQLSGISPEKVIILLNPGNVNGTLSVNGTNWIDSTNTVKITVNNTKYSMTSGLYATKTALDTTLQNMGTLSPSVNTDTYWQLQANLLSTSFLGDLTQALNFRMNCDDESGGAISFTTLDVGTNADGTVQGTVTRSNTIHKLGTYSWTTNAGSVKVNTAGPNEWALNDGDFTVNFWLYMNQLSGNRYIWQHTPQSSAGTNPYFFTQSSTGGNLAPFIFPDNNSTGYNAYSTALSTGTWYMATAVRNTANDSYCVYLNSVLQSCTGISDSITFSNAQSDWCLMNYNCQTTSQYALDGYMDDMAVWAQALTPTQINTLYNGGSGNTADTLDLKSIKVYWDFEQDPAGAAPQLTNVAPDTAYNTVSFPVSGTVSGNNWIFDLSGLDGTVYSATLDGNSLSSTEISGIQNSAGSTWTKATPSTFTVTSGGNAQVLVVAGGGAGGYPYGGGGGAGGLLYSSSKSISAGTYPVTVGAGGKRIQVGSTVPFGYDYWAYGTGENGGNSVFSDMTTIGGGGGRTYYSSPANGGSGGGGSVYSTSAGSGTSGQGNSGASGTSDGGYSWAKGGGGGGAGGAPTSGGMCANGGGSTSCNGGAGLQYSISGTTQYYAAGGGGWWIGGAGGSGGSGVGGQGGNGLGEANHYCDGALNNPSLLSLRTEPDDRGKDAVQNTGSGGGGGACVDRTSLGTHTDSTDGVGITGKGANGIVIISYPTGSISAAGGTVTTSGGNTIHTFTYVNPTPTLLVKYVPQ